jgi:hypothetical protein
MKLKTYNYDRQQWDRFKHFHVLNGPFVQFATGELMVVHSKPDPHMRRMYDQYNVSLTHTTDGHFQFYTREGEKVPKAWLTYKGGQYLLVDHDTKKAVAFRDWYPRRDANLPQYLQDGMALFLREGGAPIGQPVKLNRPYRLSPEQNEWVNTIVQLSKAHCALNDLEPNTSFWSTQVTLEIKDLCATDAQQRFETYTRTQIQTIAGRGFKIQERLDEYEPFLLIK